MYVLTIDQQGSTSDIDRVPELIAFRQMMLVVGHGVGDNPRTGPGQGEVG